MVTGVPAGATTSGDLPDDVFTIDPPTDAMGYGNVRLTMKLAQANLESLGITQPSNEQLSAMLVGGEIDGVQFEGILNERASGAGWGEIARRYDIKVGQLMGNAPASAPDLPVEIAPEPTTSADNGYIPGGAGDPALVAGGQGRALDKVKTNGRKANGYIPSGATAGGSDGARGNPVAGSNPRKANGYIASGNGGNAQVMRASHGASRVYADKPGNGQAKGYIPSHRGTASGLVSAGNLSAAATTGAANGQGLAKGQAKQHGKDR
jgi:hypothetical protein